MKIDLHTHTNFSACADKENTWQKLLQKAEEEQIKILSITDHNTCVFYKECDLKNASMFFSGKIISGIELDVVENGIAFELLAYNFDIKKIYDWSSRVYGTLQSRQEKIKEKLIEKILNNNLDIDCSNTLLLENEYAHKWVYDNMIKFSSNLEFFRRYNIGSFSDLYRLSTEDEGFPLYIDAGEVFPGVEEVVQAIHQANGVVVLAHPYNYKHNVNVGELLNIALKKGVDGVEAFHPSCNTSQSNSLIEFALANDLIVTGGSDYHGTEKHNVMGLDDESSNFVVGQQNFEI